MNHEKTESTRGRWQLPFGFFTGPILWGLEILVGYGLATVSCTGGNKLPVYLTVGISALIVLVASILAYQAWKTRAKDSMLVETDRAQETLLFWAVSGFMISTLFFLLILATAAMAIFLSPCPIITMPLP